MKMLGKSIITRQGEQFVLSCKVLQDDGSPYVLLESIPNPYIVISISSTPYSVEGKYKCNYWLDLSQYPKFESSVPIRISDTNLTNKSLPDTTKYSATSNIYYTAGEETNYYKYVDDKTGYVSYDFVFSKQFLTHQTKDWVESQYQYNIKIIGGDKTNDILKNMYKSIYPYRLFQPTDNLTLYNEIKKCKPEMVKNIRPDAPLANYSIEDTLQRMEKLIIKQDV